MKGPHTVIYSFSHALMIVRNATNGYDQSEIRKAAVFVLGTLDANEEDCLDACSALGYADMMHVQPIILPGARCSNLDGHPFSGAVSAGDY